MTGALGENRMKKGFILAAVCISAVSCWAGPVGSVAGFGGSIKELNNFTLPARTRDVMQENRFGDTPVFEAAKKGNVSAVRELERVADNGTYLFKKGKNGNNVLHAARNLATFEALLASIRYFYPSDYKERTYALLEDRNAADETPLFTHLSYGHGDIFAKYFRFTNLYERILDAKADLDRGGLAAEMAQYKMNRVLREAQNAAGVSLLQMAKANASQPQMEEVISFLQQEAPYLH